MSSKARGVRVRIVVEDASASCACFLFLAASFSIVVGSIEASPLGAFRLLRVYHVGKGQGYVCKGRLQSKYAPFPKRKPKELWTRNSRDWKTKFILMLRNLCNHSNVSIIIAIDSSYARSLMTCAIIAGGSERWP